MSRPSFLPEGCRFSDRYARPLRRATVVLPRAAPPAVRPGTPVFDTSTAEKVPPVGGGFSARSSGLVSGGPVDIGALPDPTPEVPGALNIVNLVGNEIIEIATYGPLVAQTTTAAIAALAGTIATGPAGPAGPAGAPGAPGAQGPAGPPGSGQTYVFLGNLTNYALANGTVNGQRVGIKDNLGIAGSTPITISGAIEGGSSVTLNQPKQAIEFVWNAAASTWQLF